MRLLADRQRTPPKPRPLHHAGYYENVKEYLDVSPIRISRSARTPRSRASPDVTPAQVALAWLTCVPIVGARTTDQLAENVAAADLALSDAQGNRSMDARYDPNGNLWGH